jgi:hypothetical protein
MANHRGGVPKDKAVEVRDAVRKEVDSATNGAARDFRAALQAYVDANGGQVGAAPLLGTDQPRVSAWLDPQKPTHPKLSMIIALARASGQSIGATLGLERGSGDDGYKALQEQCTAMQGQIAELVALVRDVTRQLEAERRRAGDAEEKLRAAQSSHIRPKERKK